MARTGYRRLATSIVAAIIVGLGLAACGGRSDATAVRASVHAYLTALARHNVDAACAVITPTYWWATAAEVDTQQATYRAHSIPRDNCRRGLGRMFSSTAARWGEAAKFTLTNLRVNGHVATAHLTIGAWTDDTSTQNARFVKAPDGVWRIDCCTGAQPDGPPSTTYWIPSESMEPTVKMGQRVTSDNAALRWYPPSLGDIVAFHPPAGAESEVPRCGSPSEGAGHRRPCDVANPTEAGETFIKRVVGLPGDRIAIVAGHVIRNGHREKDPYILPCLSSRYPECTFRRSIVVPAGDYYVLGDNRGASDDSRFWGPVKRAWIIGIVTP